MATANSNPNQSIGTTLAVNGTIQAQLPGQDARTLHVGSPVFLNDRIITGNDGMISIIFGDAARTQLDLGRMSDVVLNEDTLQYTLPEEFSDAAAEVEQIQEALLTGTFDPTTDLEPTAAGPAAAAGPASDGGGTSYVEFGLTGDEVTPTSGAETRGVGLDFLNPPPPELEEPIEPTPEPEPEAGPVAVAPATPPTPTEVSIIPPPPPPPTDFSPSAGDFASFVEERGLPDGTDGPDSSLTTTSGTLIDLGIDFGGNGAGFVTFSHSGTTVTAVLDGNPATATPLAGTYGTLTIFGDGTWQYEITDNTIVHSGINLVGAADTVPDAFTFTVFDADGDSDDGTLTIAIYDDGPVATGAIIDRTVEEEELDNFSEGSSPIEGSDGNPDDSDGPEDAAQPDSTVITGSLSSLVDMGADNPGTFGITLPPGLPALSSQGEAITYELNGTTLEAWVRNSGSADEPPPDTDEPISEEPISQDRLIFTFDVQSDGTYTFTLLDQLDHVSGNDENSDLQLIGGGSLSALSFGNAIIATDADGDTTSFVPEALQITIVDDVPILVPFEETQAKFDGPSGLAFLGVQEDALGNATSNTENFDDDDDSSTGDLDHDWQTDHSSFELSGLVKVGADENLTWSLSQPEGEGEGEEESPDYASSLTSKGETVYYHIEGNTLTGYTGTLAEMNVIFTFTVDATTGRADFNLNDQLDHSPGVSGSDYETLQITDLGDFVNATDFDGDSVNLAGRIWVSVENDVPTSGQTASIYVQEDALGNKGDFDDQSLGILDDASDVEQVSGSLAGTVVSGADEPATFKLVTIDSPIDSGLKSNNQTVFYTSDGTTLTAATATGTVFTFTVDASGNYTFDLEDQLDHSGNEDDSENLQIQLGQFVEATDADNDTINLEGLVSIFVENDVPQPAIGSEAIVGKALEDGLSRAEGDLSEGIRENGETLDDDEASGSSDPADASNLSHLFTSGADEQLSFGITTDSNILNGLSSLSSHGDKLYYVSNGTTLEAKAEGDDRTVFTLEVNSDGSWEFDLKDQLDHVDDGTNTENWALATGTEDAPASVNAIDFSSIITATDADGDTTTGSATGSFTVQVQDDVPQAEVSGTSYFVSEYAGFNNIIGTYRLDENGDPINAKIFIGSSNSAAGGNMGEQDPNTNMGDFEEGTKFFVIANGANTLGDLTDAELKFVENTSGTGPAWLLEIDNSTSYSAPVYYMDVALNADGQEHFKDENGNFLNEIPAEGGEIRIEDLSLGDADYDDTVLRVQVGPVVDEANLLNGTDSNASALTVSGNLFTGAGGVKIETGADEPGVLTINANIISTTNTGANFGDSLSLVMDGNYSNSVTVASEAGVLVVHADGSWEYTLQQNTTVHPDNDKGGQDNTDGDSDRGTGDQVQDIFDLTFTDADGDEINPQIVININDDGPVAGESVAAYVQEDALGHGDEGDHSTGNLDSPGDVEQVSGSLAGTVVSGADEPATFRLVTIDSPINSGLKSNNQTVFYTSDGTTLTAATVAGTVFTFTVDASGNYTFDLEDQLDHSGNDDDNENLQIQLGQFVEATDADNDTVNLNGLVSISVENDIPQATVQPAAIVGTVLEDGLSAAEGDLSEGIRENGETVDDDEDSGSSDAADASNLANLFDDGADEPLTFGISTDPAVLSNLDTLYSQGEQLHYLSNGTTLEANTEADGSGRSVFTLEVNNDGSWSFDLKDQLDHVDDNTNSENWSLEGSTATAGSIDFSSVITATDADGDTVTGAAPDSFRVEVQDDIPEAATTSQIPGNMNLVLILDNSGSMYSNSISFGGGTVTRAEALQASVIALLTSLATDSDAGSIYKVHIVEYNTDSAPLGTFTITGGDANSANAAIAAIQGMNEPGFGDEYTNYEAGYQQALQWVNSGDPLTEADVDGTLVNQVLFISDGDPNRWNDPDLGQPGGPDVDGSGGSFSSTALNQVTGADGTNEITQLDAWADSVRAVGLAVSDDGTDNSNDQDDRLDTLDLTGNALNITSGDQLLAVLPELIMVTAPIISTTIEEDDLTVDGDGPTDPDSSTGINEDGSSNGDEASGSIVSTDATNLANLFVTDADEQLTYSLSSNLADLPTLYSNGTALSYGVAGNTLTATAGAETVFTFTVNPDGSWSFDLDGQLDHVVGDGENFELRTGDGSDKTSGIDLSSLIVATDADGDELTATTGAFVVNIQDDVPEVGTPQDSLMAIEEGNSLTASLNIIGSGADDPHSITLKLTEGTEVKSIGGANLTSGGKELFWHDNGDGSWSAVTKDGSGDLNPAAKSFTISVDEAGGTYTVVQDGVLDGASSTKTINFDSALSGGNTYEAVFGSGGTSSTIGQITTYSNGIFVWAKGSQDLTNPFGWNGSSDTWVDDTTTVNYSASGVGVGNGAMIDGETEGSGRDSEILSIKFFSEVEVDNSGTNKEDVRVNESNSTALELTAVTLVLDHLGGAEKAFYTLWHEGVQVSQTYQISGLDGTTGSSADNKDDLLHIDSSQLNAGETVFDEIRLEAGSGGDNAYRIESAEVEIFQEGVDETILIPVEIEDADGDVIQTDFSVTFDGRGNLDAESADAADGDTSISGMVIAGSSEGDEIIGTDYDDTIDGNGGDDTIDGGAGDDMIEGGSGDDLLVGNVGDDVIYGDEGSDELEGGAGEDQLVGGEGADTLEGGDDDDVLVGDEVNFSNPSDPLIVEDNAPDVIDGGGGTDIAGDQPETAPAGDDSITTAESIVTDIDTLVPPPDDEV